MRLFAAVAGMVISDKVEDASHSERRIFSGGQIDDIRTRTGAPTSLARHDMGLATIIVGAIEILVDRK